MAPKNPEHQKVTLNLRLGDFDYLASICNPQGIATSVVIRNLVAQKVDEIRKREGTPIIKLESEE